jgi:hypothetical protein
MQMLNESHVKSSIGQQLKSEESLSGTLDVNWASVLAVFPSPTGGAMQAPQESSVSQTQPEFQKVIENTSQMLPKRLELSPTYRLKPKQIWEGTVISCEPHRFTARLVDRTNSSNPDEIAYFDSDEISGDDRSLVQPGASFYWTVGTERTPAGQVKNVAMVTFRRLPRWNKSSFRKAKERAKAVLALYDPE